MTKPRVAPPATIVIFGASGDLAHRLLMPSLVHLVREGLVDDGLRILGVSQTEFDDEDFRRSFEQFDTGENDSESYRDAWQSLRERIHYMVADVTRDDCYAELADRLQQDGVTNALFYLAIAPGLFQPIIEGLGKAGLMKEETGFRRLAVEKPFGHDAKSAAELNAMILRQMDENQIFRIDHFLGKETVQNIMVARFANAMIEAVWSRQYIDHVQITVAESVAVGTRGKFFDATGTLRDMVPNHLFQILAMTAMEPPNRFDAESVRESKAQLLRAIRTPTAQEAREDAVRGVYTAGAVEGVDVPAYSDTDGIAAESRTETYAAMKLMIDNWRWAGVPFYLRTGKALAHKDSEVVVYFKPVPFADFRDANVEQFPGNKLILQLQPDEGIQLDFMVKKPGAAIDAVPVAMTFSYAELFDIGGSTGYESLIYDMLIGDQTLFQRADGVEAAWRIVDPILESWRTGKPETYQAGSDGPPAAADLLQRDGRSWHEIGQ